MTSIWRKFFSLRRDSQLFFRNWPVSFYFWMFLTQGFKQIVSVSCSCHPSWCCFVLFSVSKSLCEMASGSFLWLGYCWRPRAVESEGCPFPILDSVLGSPWEETARNWCLWVSTSCDHHVSAHRSFLLSMTLCLFFHLSPFIYSERDHVLSAANLSWTLTGLVYESKIASWDPHNFKVSSGKQYQQQFLRSWRRGGRRRE